MIALKPLFLYIGCLTIIVLASADKNVYFILNAPISTAQPIPKLPPGYSYYPDIKTAYKIYAIRLNWTSAQEACSTEGARLAIIDTPKKLQYINNMRPWHNLVWTGIYRESTRNEWRSVDGGPLSPELPMIHLMYLNIGNCISISGFGASTRLYIMPCSETRRYVCEIPDAK